MSTPTSRPPQDGPEPDGGTNTADQSGPGQHAAPRATPPPSTSEQPTVSPSGPAAAPPGGREPTAPAGPDVPTGPRTGAAATPPASAPRVNERPEPAAPAAGPTTDPQATRVGDTPPQSRPSATPPPPPGDQPTRRRDRTDGRPAERELPEPPAKPGAGRHLLGILLGLALTPIALLLTGIGTARLADVAGTTDMGTDTLGITLLVVGLVLLTAIVLLGAWTAAVPLTGGLVWGLGLGLAYLVVPGVMEDTAESWLGTDAPAAVEQLARSAMSGQLVLVGILLVAAGIAAAMARRAGRRWAQGVAAAEAARAEALNADRDRIRYEADERARGRTT